MKTSTLILLTLLLLSIKPAIAMPVESRVPGGIAIIKLEAGIGTPNFTFNNKPVLVTELDGQPVAVVGLPLSLKPGEYYIQGHYGNKRHLLKKFFSVNDKQYTTQHITIKNKRKVNPLAKDMKRITSERARKRKAANYWAEETPDLNFLTPTQGIKTGSYGKKRVFNGQPRRPHSGMDIAADKGTPILSPADGTIIESGDFFFSGNIVYIHHGKGLITLFAHMDRIDVKVGDKVNKGQQIGLVGATGRVTGPHLHWSVGLNGNWVDPELFISE